MTGHEDVHALSGAYAVDALDHEERARFEQHLRDCPACRAEVAGLREATAFLSGDAEVQPPAGLRDRVLADIGTVRPLPPQVETATRQRTPRRWRFPGIGAPQLLAAAAVLAVLMAVGAAWLRPWAEDPDPVPTAAERVLEAPDAVRASSELPRGATATVVLSPSVGRAVIQTEDLPPAPEGKVYELWLQTPAGELVPAGLMPDRADATVVLEGDASDATGVGITVEPDGGSPRPTTEPIAFFDLS